MGRTRRALVIAAFTLVSCTSHMIPAETPISQDHVLRLYATTPLIPAISPLTTAYSQQDPSITFEVVTGNFEAEYRRLQEDQSAYMITNHLPSDPIWAAPIGQDGIAVIVHPRNPIRQLSTDTLRELYRGRVSNWSTLGGTDIPVTVFTREAGSGTRAEFERFVTGQDEITQAARLVPSSAAMVDAVGRTPGGIGYVSMSYLDERVRALAINGITPTLEHIADNTYPLRSFIYIAGFREPQTYYRAFIYWVQSPEGQAILGRQYAPLLRP